MVLFFRRLAPMAMRPLQRSLLRLRGLTSPSVGMLAPMVANNWSTGCFCSAESLINTQSTVMSSTDSLTSAIDDMLRLIVSNGGITNAGLCTISCFEWTCGVSYAIVSPLRRAN